MALKLLMNHTLAESNDVIEGYVDQRHRSLADRRVATFLKQRFAKKID